LQVVKQRPGSRLADGQPQIGRLAANLVLDSIKISDALQRFGCGGRGVDSMDIVELAPCVCPAGNLIDGATAVQMMEPCIGVGLQAALEMLQMLPWMFALTIF